MRPPTGSYSETSLYIANQLGYKTVFWHYGYNDWDPAAQPNAKRSLEKLLASNEPGGILLLHSVSKTNSRILDEYIKLSKKQGYSFKLLK